VVILLSVCDSFSMEPEEEDAEEMDPELLEEEHDEHVRI
jgi:hypothetical protein